MTGDGLAVNGVRAVMLFSADPDAASAWWGALLGLPAHAEGEFRWLDLPGGAELAFHPADEAKNPTGASTVAYLRVDSLSEALDRLLAAGAQLHRGPLDVAPGRRIAQVRDPFGAVLGIDGP